MNIESIIMLAVSVLVFVYLAYAMLRPEKF
jgi:K+-transporting ATPase KdpF subunit